MGSGYSSVDTKVASNSRDLWFKSSHRHNLHRTFRVNFIERTKVKIKLDGAGPLKIAFLLHKVGAFKRLAATNNKHTYNMKFV